MNMFFLLPVSSKPRCLKRIDNFRKLGITQTIFSFERDYFEGKKDMLNYISLGYIQHKNYLKRIIPLLKAFFKIRREMVTISPTVIYAFEIDLAFIAVLLKVFSNNNCQVVYECGDIQPLMMKSKIVRFIEKWTINRCTLVVTTSEGFIANYFIKKQNVSREKLFLIENKLNEPLRIQQNKEQSSIYRNKPITIGYFGLLSYTNTWDLLVKLVNKYPDRFIIYVRGFSDSIDSDELKKYTDNPNFIYDGPFLQPDDLSEMHSKVDLIWSAYITYDKFNKYNLGWAMRNQFYESCFLKTPMIVQEETQAEKYVREYDIGIAINMFNVEQTLEKISSITLDDISMWKNNFDKLPKDFSVYTNEHEKLAKLLNLL